MGKLTYLQLTNRVLDRINETEIADVTAATGKALIITHLINEAQNAIWPEANWYSLYKTRAFSTVTYTASTITFNNADPDTLTDSASGFGSFQAGQTIIVDGSTSNDGEYLISTAAAGTLTLQTADALTAEAAGDSVTVTAVTYPVASDWGRTIDLMDYTNDLILVESVGRVFDETDPNWDDEDDATHFSLQGGFYRFYPIIDSTATIRERYYAIPTALSVNASTSDLPIECENCIIHWAWSKILEYIGEFEKADRIRLEYTRLLGQAVHANDRMIDKIYAGVRKVSYF